MIECTLLHLAARNSHVKLVGVLIGKGADIKAADNECGGTPLHWAAKADNTTAPILYKGADVNIPDNDGGTPLHWAAKAGNTKVVKLLLDKGASVNAANDGGYTPLHWAADETYGVDICTPLHLDAKTNTEVVGILLGRGAEVNIRSNGGCTPLHLAARNNSTQIAKLLLARGAKPLLQDEQCRTPICFAKDEEMRELLEKAGKQSKKDNKETNSRFTDGQTPLHSAAMSGDIESVKELIANVANPNVADKKGRTPLHLAVEKKSNLEVLDTLIKAGADLNLKDENGWTALHYAVLYNNEGALSLLLNQDNVDINAQTNEGMTPLCAAVRFSRKNQVELLLANGAEINVQDKEGNTPLHLAAQSGSKYTIGCDNELEYMQKRAQTNVKIAKLLLTKGADPLLENNDCKTPSEAIGGPYYSEEMREILKKEEDKAKMPVNNGGANPLLERNKVQTPIYFVEGKEMTKPSKEAEKAYKMPVIVGVIIGIISTFSIAALLVDCGLSALVIAGIAVGCGIVIGAIVGGAAYMLLKPSTEIKVEQAATEQAAPQGAIYSHS